MRLGFGMLMHWNLVTKIDWQMRLVKVMQMDSDWHWQMHLVTDLRLLTQMDSNLQTDSKTHLVKVKPKY